MSKDAYYVWIAQGWDGPLNEKQLAECVRNNTYGLGEPVWTEGYTNCKRLYELQFLEPELPPKPSVHELRHLKETLNAPPPGHEPSLLPATPKSTAWYLQYQGSEFGPLTMSELNLIVKSGKLGRPLYAWKQGQEDWQPVEKISELSRAIQDGIDQGAIGALGRDNQRRAARLSLMATVKFGSSGDASGIFRYQGICKNISTGGVLILSTQTSGLPNSSFWMQVDPFEGSGVNKFTVGATVVRILPDKTGFSAKFHSLPKETFEQIQKFSKG